MIDLCFTKDTKKSVVKPYYKNGALTTVGDQLYTETDFNEKFTTDLQDLVDQEIVLEDRLQLFGVVQGTVETVILHTTCNGISSLQFTLLIGPYDLQEAINCDPLRFTISVIRRESIKKYKAKKKKWKKPTLTKIDMNSDYPIY